MIPGGNNHNRFLIGRGDHAKLHLPAQTTRAWGLQRQLQRQPWSSVFVLGDDRNLNCDAAALNYGQTGLRRNTQLISALGGSSGRSGLSATAARGKWAVRCSYSSQSPLSAHLHHKRRCRVEVRFAPEGLTTVPVAEQCTKQGNSGPRLVLGNRMMTSTHGRDWPSLSHSTTSAPCRRAQASMHAR